MKNCLLLVMILLSSASFGEENLQTLVTSDDIAQKIHQAANDINKTYQGEPVTVLMVMKGAITLTADLIRKLEGPVTLEYVQSDLYAQKNGKNNEVRLTGIEKLKVKDQNILIVDDVLDSGNTMAAIIKTLKQQHPKSVKTLVLFTKKERAETPYYPDYALFNMKTLMDKFPVDGKERLIVGYGIDYNGHYRELPGLYIYEKRRDIQSPTPLKATTGNKTASIGGN